MFENKFATVIMFAYLKRGRVKDCGARNLFYKFCDQPDGSCASVITFSFIL